MSPEEKLLSLLEAQGRGAKSKLAKYLDVNPVYVNRWVNDKKYSIPREQIPKLEEYFSKPSGYFLATDLDTKPVFKVPVIGTASCGGSDMNHMQDDSLYCYYNGDYWHQDLYCVIANGDSMAIDIEDGDEVICDPNAKPMSGDIVHYRINGESAIKILVEDLEANIIRLKPYNPSEDFKTRTIRLDDDEVDDLKMSKVVAVNKLSFNNRAARLRLVGE
jgi:phage repressor protein C with HTH and peptisase S24 domain